MLTVLSILEMMFVKAIALLWSGKIVVESFRRIVAQPFYCANKATLSKRMESVTG